MDGERAYICIDLKSFYASVECVERGLDPMTARLVVADPERKSGTVCLAVTPGMKALGVRNRCRVYEIPKGIEYITAPPRMRLYLEYSARIYSIYLDYFSKDDIHVYSVDEVFIDVTPYLKTYKKTPLELARFLVSEVRARSGIPAAAGVGTNLYLCKIAMDIMAKRSPDFIAELNETTYREKLWRHVPLTDFWRVGPGTAERLEKLGVRTMEGITKLPETVLYKTFGVDAELLIDHAWGREPTTIADIKAYVPKSRSITSGQVLMRDYNEDEAEIVLREMVDLLSLDLLDRGCVTPRLSLRIVYSSKEGRQPSHGGVKIDPPTESELDLIPAALDLFRRIVVPGVPIRGLNISFDDIFCPAFRQANFFEDDDAGERHRRLRKTVSELRHRFGGNAILKGTDFEEGATTRERNNQIGGHKA